MARNMSKSKMPMPTQDPHVRNQNFSEVALGYTAEMAMEEARRCLSCKHKPCIAGCPVAIDIPAFIEKSRRGFSRRPSISSTKPAPSPAVCGRVCPQETQCEELCVRGLKGSRWPSAA